jgi:hypothetical protein
MPSTIRPETESNNAQDNSAAASANSNSNADKKKARRNLLDENDLVGTFEMS